MMKVLAISNLPSFWPNFSMINSKKTERNYLIEASIGALQNNISKIVRPLIQNAKVIY
jgi:hypothetical protein